MEIPRVPHRWSLAPRDAARLQLRLAAQVDRTPPRGRLRFAVGVDGAYPRRGDSVRAVGGVVLWDLETRSAVESQVAFRACRFPYVPGLLSFREVPALLAALRKLERRPDVILCDGHGFAHPRRFGLACHVGLLCDLPTVGVAKSRLIGSHREPGTRRGARTAVLDAGERVATLLRTREGARPVYVSIGHRMDLETAERIVLACGEGHRLPEPIHLADRLVARAARGARR